MTTDKMQTSRFELKYITEEAVALQIRDFVREFLDLDENGVGKPNYSYPVHSVYLDSPFMTTYWDTINGNKNRFKLRVRFYNDNPETPVFFEIKRRMNNCIMKQRGAVRRTSAPRLVEGFFPAPEDLMSQNPKHLAAVQNFVRLSQMIGALPQMHVAYAREAYVPHDDNSCRLTLDRHVCSEPEPILRLSTKMARPICIWGDAVVVELKFTNRFPNWFGDLVRAFGLNQCGAAKYADGVSLQEGRIPHHKHMPADLEHLGWEDTLQQMAQHRPFPPQEDAAPPRTAAGETASREIP
jgi:hypothetical protein